MNQISIGSQLSLILIQCIIYIQQGSLPPGQLGEIIVGWLYVLPWLLIEHIFTEWLPTYLPWANIDTSQHTVMYAAPN